MIYPPPFSKEKLPAPLLSTIEKIHALALEEKNEKTAGILAHLTDPAEAYQYVYYTALVHTLLQGKKGKIIDMGGFLGQVTALLRSLEYNCYNLVTEYPTLKKSFELLNIPFVLSKNPTRLPYADASVCAVVSSGVLEHVHEQGWTDAAALQEIYRVLEPGGYFFCWNLPRKYALLEYLSRVHGTSCHDRLYTQKQLKEMTRTCGFEIILLENNSGVLTIKWGRSILRLFDPWTQFVLDYYASKIPLISFFSHHITAILQKPKSSQPSQ